MFKYSESPLSQLPYLELFQSGEGGGAVRGFFGGASLDTFSGEAQLKKSPCISKNQTCISLCTLPTILLNLVLEELILVVRHPSTYSLHPSCPNIFSYFIILRAENYSIVNSDVQHHFQSCCTEIVILLDKS